MAACSSNHGSTTAIGRKTIKPISVLPSDNLRRLLNEKGCSQHPSKLMYATPVKFLGNIILPDSKPAGIKSPISAKILGTIRLSTADNQVTAFSDDKIHPSHVLLLPTSGSSGSSSDISHGLSASFSSSVLQSVVSC